MLNGFLVLRYSWEERHTILIYFPFKTVTNWHLLWMQHTKTCLSRLTFQDDGRHHLGFLKFHIFNSRNGQESRSVSLGQISQKSLEPRPRYHDFRFLRWLWVVLMKLVSNVRPSTKSFFDLIEIWYVGRGWRLIFAHFLCHVTLKLAVSRSRPSVPYGANFSRWRPPPSWILKFSNF